MKTIFITGASSGIGKATAELFSANGLGGFFGNTEFPLPDEAANIIWQAVTDGKDQLGYPTDSICQKLYDQYISMGIEKFKQYFSKLLFEE